MLTVAVWFRVGPGLILPCFKFFPIYFFFLLISLNLEVSTLGFIIVPTQGCLRGWFFYLQGHCLFYLIIFSLSFFSLLVCFIFLILKLHALIEFPLLSIRDIRPGIQLSCIRCRVVCLWCVNSSKRNGDIDSIEVVLVDKMVNHFYYLLVFFLRVFILWTVPYCCA